MSSSRPCSSSPIRSEWNAVKTKPTARKMMAMMLAINRENVDSRQVVTCNSCHHGVSRPVWIPMIAESGPESSLGRIPEAEGTGIHFPLPDAVIVKYVNAIGRTPPSPKSRHDRRINSRLTIRIDLVKFNILDGERCRSGRARGKPAFLMTLQLGYRYRKTYFFGGE